MKSLFLERYGAWLRYLDMPGQGPIRVYLHGLCKAGTADFPELVSHPALVGYRALLVDLIGFGFSDRPPDFAYTIEEHARTVAALLDALGATGCAVVGHSSGGSVAVLLAALRPDLVSRLVVAEGNLEPGPQEGSNAVFSRGVAAQTEEHFLTEGYPEVLSRGSPNFRGTAQVADPRAVHRSSVSLVGDTRPTLRDRFLALTMPRVYVFGELTLANADMAARAEDLSRRGVRVLVVPGVGHGMGLNDDAAPFAQVLRTALTD
jgi:pimeloyl-ACP methyl ester carboxylesterase